MTIQEVFSWLADVFEEDEENIHFDMVRSDIAAWDSLGMLTLMARLDEDFDILLEEDELDNLQSVKNILELLQRNEKVEL